jgi:hypothetical protein
MKKQQVESGQRVFVHRSDSANRSGPKQRFFLWAGCGYAKRFSTFYGDTAIGTLMTNSVFPTLLHQDPRYFQLGKAGTWHRAMYAVSQIFITRSDIGERQF